MRKQASSRPLCSPAPIKARSNAGGARRQFLLQVMQRLAAGPGGRMALDLLQGLKDGYAGGRELGELLIQFGPLGKLAG
jgi:hypothetical protein